MVNLLPFTVTQPSKSFQFFPPSVLYPLNASVGVPSVTSIFAPAAYCMPPLSSSSRTILVIGASASFVFSLETVIIHAGSDANPLERTADTSESLNASFVRPGAVFSIICFKVKSAVSVATLPGLLSIKTSFLLVTVAVFCKVTETVFSASSFALCFCSIVAILAALVSVSFVVYTICK